ncbi:neuronal acetylcholine receptor subunit alpha-6 [Elysia marginata]|uniref:Neuronal acetylcholine receptor subunit alpha-6 n=1 Tax=Elysia marginata TaxID=1093978 RepID=A0AAV4JCZ1_9GAST|nr:neuronal acetylcholine receptor subunit alpha-6 [Elysia marginata]
MSTYEEISISPRGSPVSWADYSPGSSWSLKSIDTTALDNLNDITRIQFQLTLKRLRTYYVMNIILPVLFLSLTASLVFYLPADAGEKIGMSMTVLLAYAVYLTIIADNMPQTSLQVSLLAVYLTMLLGFTAMGVILSVVVLALHHKCDEIPVGRRVAATTREIRRLLGLGCKPKIPSNRVSPQPCVRSSPLRHSDVVLANQGLPNSTDSSEKQMILHEKPVSARSGSRMLRPNTAAGEIKEKIFPVSDASSICADSDPETITWPKVAETVDRLFFITFSSFVFFITVFMLPYMALKAD